MIWSLEDREGLRGWLFRQVSPEEPELAEELTDMIMEMDDEEMIECFHDPDELEEQVLRWKDILLGRSTTDDDEDGERSSIIPESNEGSWSPSTQSTEQRVALIAQPEGNEAAVEIYHIEDRDNDSVVGHWRTMPSHHALLSHNLQRQRQSQEYRFPGDRHPPATTSSPTHLWAEEIPTMEDIVNQADGMRVIRERQERYPEATRNRAQRDIMEGSTSSSMITHSGDSSRVCMFQNYGSCNSQAPKSSASYVPEANMEPGALAGRSPMTVSETEEMMKTRVCKGAPHPTRPIQHDAPPYRSPAAVETEQPSKVPLMQVAHQPRPPPRAARDEELEYAWECSWNRYIALSGGICCSAAIGLTFLYALVSLM